MKDFVLKHGPVWSQNVAISVYNTWLYRRRHGGAYNSYREYFARWENASLDELEREQQRRLAEFLSYACRESAWYKRIGAGELHDYPVLEKEDLIRSLRRISTIPERAGEVSLTGGTTGASMRVIFTREDIQERNALLDHFRANYGYRLGVKVAWFSGKDIVRERDLLRGLCYRDDYFGKIRFFSTFHINDRNFDSYWEALNRFSPQYLVGFPSSVYDLCRMAETRGMTYGGGAVKGFFPTAETVLPHHRELVGRVLGCPLHDQYASSEGAPFILECSEGRLHMNLLSGIFEVVDERLKPASEGELLVTSFSTRGTPLIRYRIGDRIKLGPRDVRCECGSSHPLVERIDGRSSDFLWSPDNGRVNLGNISNCTKGVEGIINFQVIQGVPDEVLVNIVPGPRFDGREKEKFEEALRARLGNNMKIKLRCVESIAREKSGKFRIVKNNLSDYNVER